MTPANVMASIYLKWLPPKVNPARYSVVVVKQGGAWKIVQHHSSPRPKPAK